MQITNIATILFATVAMSAALPTESGSSGTLPDKGDGSGSSLCSNNQKAACCNSAGNGNSAGGVLGGVLDGVLAGSCSLTVIGGQCTQGSIACCPTSGQTGLVNVGSICAPISL